MFATQPAFFSELFGTNVRYSGVSLGYQLTAVFAGGLAPFVATALLVWAGGRRLNYGTLEIEVTVDDLKTFTKPFTFTMQQRLMPDTELIEFVCGENNRSAAHLVGN